MRRERSMTIECDDDINNDLLDQEIEAILRWFRVL